MPILVEGSWFIVQKVFKTINYQLLTINWRRRRPGFTLIEIALFTFLLLALVSILYAVSGTYIHSRNSSLRSLATKIASKEIENLRKTPFGNLPSSGSFYDADLTKLPSYTTNRSISNYQSSTKIKQATVTITWTERGIANQVVLDTLISEYGL